MKDSDLYRVLGVKRSANSDEIRSAFRELVKRFHPDLFAAPADKERATEKLREINEAYAVLGNPQRRREYDLTLVQKPAPRQRSRPPRRPRETARERPKGVRRRASAKKLRLRWTIPSNRKLGYGFGLAAAVLLLFYANRTEPHWITAWVLVEKSELSGEGGGAPQQASQGWLPVAQFASAPECAGALRTKVQEDERQGAKAVFDERSGMMAITVRVGPALSEAAKLKSAMSGQADAPAPSEPSPARPVFKQVRNLECRATRRMERSSWMERALRRAGP